MAVRPSEISGYEYSRFQGVVDDIFRCSICLNVAREPRTCQNNDHIYCHDCIKKHLRVNSPRCPECQERLTVKTLRRPRIVDNYLSKLKISCDYSDRGCPEFTKVEDLQDHVSNCGFAPVLCSNVNCSQVINKKDRIQHETQQCEYRKTVFRKDVAILQQDLKDHDGKMATFMEHIDRGLKEQFEKYNENLHEKLNNERAYHDRRQQETKKDIMEMKREIKNVQKNLSSVTKDVEEIKDFMAKMLEKMSFVDQFNKKSPSQTEEMLQPLRKDILIAGSFIKDFSSRTSEIFSWKRKEWIEIASMNDKHSGSSSFIHDDQLFVVGGFNCKSIEILNLKELPLAWVKDDEMPEIVFNSQIVAHKGNIFHIGGYNRDERTVSDLICKLHISSWYQLEEICSMYESRQNHSAEVFENKILIFGGQDEDKDALDSVLLFDPVTMSLEEMPSLPHPLTGMATVRWKDQVIFIGGCDDDENAMNNVFMYDCRTGKITMLPSMLEKRCWCCAVITYDTVVVMGGRSFEGTPLSSVECLQMGRYAWEYLPSMKRCRSGAIAEALPYHAKNLFLH